MTYKIGKIGKEVYRNSKQGGGTYMIIGHKNCSRCSTLIESREQIEPSKSQRKSGHYYTHWSWCHKCGLFQPVETTRVIV